MGLVYLFSYWTLSSAWKLAHIVYFKQGEIEDDARTMTPKSKQGNLKRGCLLWGKGLLDERSHQNLFVSQSQHVVEALRVIY